MIHKASSSGGVDWLPPPDTPIVIHGGQFTGGVHPLNQFVPESVGPLPCFPAFVRHTLLCFFFFFFCCCCCCFFFFNELISFIGSLDKCHTSVFNALIYLQFGKMLKRSQNPQCLRLKPYFHFS